MLTSYVQTVGYTGSMSICAIEGCGKSPTIARGWCRTHYRRWLATGTTEGVDKRFIRTDPEVRFLAKTKRLENGCLEWQGYVSPFGYGKFGLAGKGADIVLAHRWAYEHWNGPIPKGGTVDHLCHNADPTCKGGVTCQHRRCVEPTHLDATATLAENVNRSHNAPINRTHCKRGHAFDAANTYVAKTGKRMCRKCHARAEKERQRRLRAGLSS